MFVCEGELPCSLSQGCQELQKKITEEDIDDNKRSPNFPTVRNPVSAGSEILDAMQVCVKAMVLFYL